VTPLPIVLAQAGGFGSNPVGFIAWIGAVFAIMYFLMIRPQQKQAKEHRTLLAGLKKGDDVVTQGGLLGRVHVVTDKTVTLEVAPGVRVRVLKSSIQVKGAVSDEPAAPAAGAEKSEKKEEK